MADLTPNDLSHLSDEEFNALCPQGYHAPGPELLSPAAEAIFFAADGMQPRQYRGRALAAAIRALADQLINVKWSVEMWELHRDFHAIATELEGQQ